MPFKSKAQMRAAFGGYLGKEMKSKAKEWADETPSPSKLPEHKKKGAFSGYHKRKAK
jgi:hypothetical protein